MDMGFDHRQWPQGAQYGAAGSDSAADSGVMSDWAGLRARFLAAQALRRASLDLPQGQRAMAGSFNETVARKLGSFEDAERAVNPNALVDGKVKGGTHVDVAGASMPGDRG